MQDELSYKVSDKVIKEMDYLLRMKEDAEEERYKRLDETIRNCQKVIRRPPQEVKKEGGVRKKTFRSVKAVYIENRRRNIHAGGLVLL